MRGRGYDGWGVAGDRGVARLVLGLGRSTPHLASPLKGGGMNWGRVWGLGRWVPACAGMTVGGWAGGLVGGGVVEEGFGVFD